MIKARHFRRLVWSKRAKGIIVMITKNVGSMLYHMLSYITTCSGDQNAPWDLLSLFTSRFTFFLLNHEGTTDLQELEKRHIRNAICWINSSSMVPV